MRGVRPGCSSQSFRRDDRASINGKVFSVIGHSLAKPSVNAGDEKGCPISFTVRFENGELKSSPCALPSINWLPSPPQAKTSTHSPSPEGGKGVRVIASRMHKSRSLRRGRCIDFADFGRELPGSFLGFSDHFRGNCATHRGICSGGADRSEFRDRLRAGWWSNRRAERSLVIAFGVRWSAELRSPLRSRPTLLNWLLSLP